MSTQAELTSPGRRLEHTREKPTATPPVDIYENNDEILLVTDVPGVTNDNISINLDKDQLTLLARRGTHASGTSSEVNASGANSRELTGPDFYRAFLVPHGIDASRIRAELSDGVLRVHLPKSEALKPRRIEVKVG